VRVAVHWPLLEPAPGERNPSYVRFVDRVLDRAARRRLRVVVVWGGVQCGRGAAPGPEPRCNSREGRSYGSDHYPERAADVSAYARAAAALVARHRGTIVAIEPANEPNNPRFLRNENGPSVYAAVLRATYREVKRRARAVQVLAGALALSDTDYLEQLYDAGIAGSFDAVSVHPYDIRFSGARAGFGSPLVPAAGRDREASFWSGLSAVRAVMARNGDGRRPIWLTEFGYRVCGGERVPCVGARAQARWLRDAFTIAAGRGVVAAISYLFQDYAGDFGGRFGMVERRGRARPALAAVTGVWRDLRRGRLRVAELRGRGGEPVALLVARRSGGALSARVMRPPGARSTSVRVCLGAVCRSGTLRRPPSVRLERQRGRAVASLEGGGRRVVVRIP
jgi:hypothetical protein